MIYIIVTLFAVYTVCSCLDGPDLKPIWKEWIGTRMHIHAENLIPGPHMLPPDAVIKRGYEPMLVQSRFAFPSRSELVFGKDEMIGYAKEKCLDGIMHEIRENGFVEYEIAESHNIPEITVIGRLLITKMSEP